jgi:hypothetical protein
MKGLTALIVLITLAAALQGCSGGADRSKAVCLLLDSGNYAAELKKAQSIVYFLLGALQPGDTLIIGRIDAGRFSEKDIIAKACFDQRPSMANAQKRSLKRKIDAFFSSIAGSDYTDISGGILQAVEALNKSGVGRKYILIYSDLEEELAKGFVREVLFPLNGFHVVAFDVMQLRDDHREPKKYLDRVEEWRKKTEKGGGQWRFIDDLERLEAIFEG